MVKTVNNAARYIKNLHDSKSPPFEDCLKVVANSRKNIAALQGHSKTGNPFGISRRYQSERYEGFYTPVSGPYKKYLDHFLRSDKNGWKKELCYQTLIYTISCNLEGEESPLELTSLRINWPYPFEADTLIYGPQATWKHTPTKNIDRALKEAERIFNHTINLHVERDSAGLETIMKLTAELHWWLAQATPYQRGSAAIAKMMACTLLKYHGIEAGGFGDIEPDCMALIQNPSEFIANYANLMRFPPPGWIN